MTERASPLVRLWTWILRDRAARDREDAGLAGLVSFVLWAGPAFGLAVGGSQMAKHVGPIWLAVIVPLVAWFVCIHFLITGPESRAKAAMLADALEPASIKAKTDSLRHALTEAANLSRDLEAQLTVSKQSLERIEADAKTFKQLADMNQQAAEAVAHVLGERYAKAERRSARWAAIWAAVGVVATLLVGLLAQYIAL